MAKNTWNQDKLKTASLEELQSIPQKVIDTWAKGGPNRELRESRIAELTKKEKAKKASPKKKAPAKKAEPAKKATPAPKAPIQKEQKPKPEKTVSRSSSSDELHIEPVDQGLRDRNTKRAAGKVKNFRDKYVGMVKRHKDAVAEAKALVKEGLIPDTILTEVGECTSPLCKLNHSGKAVTGKIIETVSRKRHQYAGEGINKADKSFKTEHPAFLYLSANVTRIYGDVKGVQPNALVCCDCAVEMTAKKERTVKEGLFRFYRDDPEYNGQPDSLCWKHANDAYYQDGYNPGDWFTSAFVVHLAQAKGAAKSKLLEE